MRDAENDESDKDGGKHDGEGDVASEDNEPGVDLENEEGSLRRGIRDTYKKNAVTTVQVIRYNPMAWLSSKGFL